MIKYTIIFGCFFCIMINYSKAQVIDSVSKEKLQVRRGEPWQYTNTTKEYIVFFHTGSIIKYIHPVYISKIPLTINLQKYELDEIESARQQSIPLTKDLYIKFHYNLIVTDSITYSETLHFIQNHKEFYTGAVNENNENSDQIGIIANGHEYYIYYKFATDFFSGLYMSLNQQNGDKKVIDKIKSWYGPF
jgi:hypothetical protein